ncbi:MAG: DUF4390 domain-containing protein [Polaromonas sp.]|uniref:DUF4390 domain-containing protein n=1 Tax=Polaromonas sp. TaxID=1869339 RepID=UPI0024881392|nr:DUF4390 domain-containing protein [Polaromonas sp.]MDI1237196.1 DUF4390 domain-containing protein [Polaromonas sp.]MDI1341956.1 DUF4390 domain-containing protein [Polaromonas sp.]
MKNAKPDSALRRLLAFWVCTVVALAGQAALATEVTLLKMERSDEGVYLSASVHFDLPPAVEDALLKGIPMFFVAEADIYRSRWYWYDKRITTATRTMRLAFQPLTRRWRFNVLPGAISVTGLRASFSQNYDNLDDALASIQRFSRWRIADAAEVEPGVRHNVDFRFRLDLSQLPRPFQIGVAGQKDWAITVETNRDLVAEPIRDLSRDLSKEAVKEAEK